MSASAGQGSFTKYAGTDQGEEWGDAKGTSSVLPTHDTTGLRRYTGETIVVFFTIITIAVGVLVKWELVEVRAPNETVV